MTTRAWLATLPADLPQPGDGRTSERFHALWQYASDSPSLGRLAEAHYDGIAILRERGLSPSPDATYGVWAAGGGADPLTIDRSGRPSLVGTKDWCSGASIVTHALVTARDGESNSLVLVAMDQPGVTLEQATWESPTFDEVDTRSVSFDLPLDAIDVIATDDWYLTRPGFWHGAVGVAACWAGCAAGLVDRLDKAWPDEAHALAHRGAVDAALWMMRAVFEAAAAEIDQRRDQGDDGQRRALRVRHIIDISVSDITTRLMRAFGPAPFAHRPDVHTVLAETDLYRRQCHAERDLESLGRLVADLAQVADFV